MSLKDPNPVNRKQPKRVASRLLLGAQLELHGFGDLGFERFGLGLLARRFLALGLPLGRALGAQRFELGLLGRATILERGVDDGGLGAEFGHKGLLRFRRGRLPVGEAG